MQAAYEQNALIPEKYSASRLNCVLYPHTSNLLPHMDNRM